MDTRPLVEPDLQLGEQATDVLSQDANVRARAALWWFDPDRQQWLFTISTPVYEERGVQAAYLRTRKSLEENNLLGKLPLDRVQIISDRHPVLEAVRMIIHSSAGPISNITLIGNVFDGMLLPDIHIYKIEKRRVRPHKKAKGREEPVPPS